MDRLTFKRRGLREELFFTVDPHFVHNIFHLFQSSFISSRDYSTLGKLLSRETQFEIKMFEFKMLDIDLQGWQN